MTLSRTAIAPDATRPTMVRTATASLPTKAKTVAEPVEANNNNNDKNKIFLYIELAALLAVLLLKK